MRNAFTAWLTAVVLVVASATAAWSQSPANEPLPPTFDLRQVGGVTAIKAQSGGTCWTHGTMAAIESNLLVTGQWKKLNLLRLPACSEYHLDWWNGFNVHANEDVKDPAKDNPTALRPHVGGDYRVAAAYLSRGDGVVVLSCKEVRRPDFRAWFKEAPPRCDPAMQRLYVRDIEWFTLGDNLEGIDVIKKRIITEGAVGTCYMVSKNYLSKDNVHYQPVDAKGDPNHAVAIIGWDDNKVSSDPAAAKAPKPGAWLIKNSWGVKRGDEGYYWISFYDKHCCRHPEMGAVSFRNLEPMTYTRFYYHDAHGWRDTLPTVSRAFNVFTATGRDTVKAVSFYTAQHKVNYTLKVFSKFENGKLSGELVSQSGSIDYCGLHTVDLRAPVKLKENDKFYVYVELSAGGHAFDRTSEIPVLLQQPGKKKKGEKNIVISRANPGESYYFDGTEWRDLYGYRFTNPAWGTFNQTANFCIKALAVTTP
jgi:hypothetical protein